jgi:hypothetical protein
MRQIYQEHKDIQFLAIDFDQCIAAGHVHNYFRTVFPDKTPNDIVQMIDVNGNDWFRTQLKYAAIYSQFVDNHPILWNSDKDKIKGIFLKNRDGRLIAALEEEYNADFESVEPFTAEQELVDLLNYRHSLPEDYKTVVMSHSAYNGVIQRTLQLLIGSQNARDFRIFTPNCNPDLTFDENLKQKIYLQPANTKNDVLGRCKKVFEIAAYSDMALYDDSYSNTNSAEDLDIRTSLIPHQTPIRIVSKKQKYTSFASMADGGISSKNSDDEDLESDFDGGVVTSPSPVTRKSTERTRLLNAATNTSHTQPKCSPATKLCSAAIMILCCSTAIYAITIFAYLLNALGKYSQNDVNSTLDIGRQ